jgi:hypothetical protein
VSRSRRASDARDRQFEALESWLLTDQEIAIARQKLGALRDVDFDHIHPGAMRSMSWQLAARSRPFARMRALGLEPPTPTAIDQVLASIVSYPPADEPPAELLALIANHEAAGTTPEAIRDRNLVAFGLRVMGGPDGSRFRREIAAGEYDPSPYELKDDPHFCPLEPELPTAPWGCACRGGTDEPSCKLATLADLKGRLEAAPATSELRVQVRPVPANRGQQRPEMGEDPGPEATVFTDVEAEADIAPVAEMAAQPVTEPYSEPADNPNPPARRNINRPQTLRRSPSRRL